MKYGLRVATTALLIVSASLTTNAQQKRRQWAPLRTAWGDPDT